MTDGLINRAWQRGVVGRLEDGRIVPAGFHLRFERWVLFEGGRTCIRFSNERGIGWEISRERALSIVKAANRQGLMQSAELCRGCGLCVTGCPQEAIRLQKIRESAMEAYYI